MPLTDDDYKAAAGELGCESAALRAVVDVESKGAPFLSDGRVVILFEAHWFSRYTRGRFDKTHPHISSPKWNKKLYKRGLGEWDRLQAAIELDRKAALMSASWGICQVMGFNFALCGFTSVEDFVDGMKTEQGQLAACVDYIKARDLDDELQRHDWAGFARGYNGKDYKANAYDTKMADAYKKFSNTQTKEVST